MDGVPEQNSLRTCFTLVLSSNLHCHRHRRCHRHHHGHHHYHHYHHHHCYHDSHHRHRGFHHKDRHIHDDDHGCMMMMIKAEALMGGLLKPIPPLKQVTSETRPLSWTMDILLLCFN